MRARCLRVIIINGVRYNLAIRPDTNWSYTAEWWNGSEYHRNTPGDSVRSISQAEREAIDEIHRAKLKKEPWLYAEIACAALSESDSETGNQ